MRKGQERNFFINFVMIMLFLVMSVIFTCKSVQAEIIKISKESVVLVEGQSQKIKIVGTKEKITWKSMNEKIATVSINGVIKGKKSGKTYIIAKFGRKSFKCRVKVESPKLNKTNIISCVGMFEKLRLSNCNHKIVWKSTNNAVVNVDSGMLSFNSVGNATVIACVHKKYYKCNILVENPSMNDSMLFLNVSDKYKIELHGCNHKVLWKSSNQSIAIVSEGIIEAKKFGEVIITASIHKKKFVCKVFVDNPVISCDRVSCYVGDCVELHIDNCRGNIMWFSDNEEVVSVKDGMIHANSVGIAKIIAKANNKDLICYITVKYDEILLEYKEKTLFIGQTERLNIKKLGNNLNNMNELIWESSSSDIVSVDNDGNLLALKEGEAIISVRNGISRATCKIVVKPEKSISIVPLDKDLYVGNETQMNVQYYNFETGDDLEVYWSTAESSVATIDKNGMLHPVSSGSTLITAECDGYLSTYIVTILNKKVDITSTSETILVGDKIPLTVDFIGFALYDYSMLTWSSAETNVATVDSYGNVTGIGTGSTIITVNYENYKDTCVVYVSE